MILEEKPSQAGKKTTKFGIKSFYSNTSYGFECKKTASVNCYKNDEVEKTTTINYDKSIFYYFC